MDGPTDEELNAAEERGRILYETAPLALLARYDAKARMMVLDLNNGSSFAFPPHRLQGLANATNDQLAAVEIVSEGFGLHWKELDADFTVPGLLAGRFGSKAYMERLRKAQAAGTGHPATAAA